MSLRLGARVPHSRWDRCPCEIPSFLATVSCDNPFSRRHPASSSVSILSTSLITDAMPCQIDLRQIAVHEGAMPEQFSDLPDWVPKPKTLTQTVLTWQEWKQVEQNSNELLYELYLENACRTALEPERSLACAALAEWKKR